MKRLLSRGLFSFAAVLSVFININAAEAATAAINSPDPIPFSFSATTVGQASVEQTFTVTKATGSALDPYSIVSVNFSAATPHFTITSDNCTGTDIIAIGGTCTFNVRFNPVAVGPQAANITITAAAGDTTIGPFGAVAGTGLPNATIQFSQPVYSISETGFPTATLTVNRTGTDTSSAFTVAYSLTPIAPASGADIGVASPASPLTFAAGVTSMTINVPIIDDAIVETTETFLASLGAIIPTTGTPPVLGTQSTALLAIGDDDGSNPPVIELSAANFAVGESAGTAQVIAIRSGNTTTLASATVDTSDDTALDGSDYTAITGGTVIFSPGEIAKAIPVAITSDALAEGNESFNITLSAPIGGAVLGSQQSSSVTIVDDDNSVALPSIELLSSSYSVSESGGSVTLTAVRSGDLSGTVDVDYATSDGSAVDPTDYTAVTATTLNFAANEVVKTFNITINGDTTPEPLEFFDVSLSNPVGATLGSKTFAQVDIIDDDGATGFEIENPAYFFGESSISNVVKIIRSGDNSRTDTVTIGSTDGTAAYGTDHTTTPDLDPAGPNTAVLTFNPGETFKTVLVNPVSDATIDGDLNFTLNLSAPSAPATLGTIADATVTVVDDDSAGAIIQFAAPTYTFSEGGVSGIVTVTRSGNTSSTVSVDFTHADLTATDGGTDYAVTDATLTFNPGEITKTIQVDLNDDALMESIETFRLTLDATSLAGGAVLGANATSDVGILDNEGQATLQFTQSSHTVSEAVGTSSFVVTRSGDASGAVSIDVVPQDVSATNGGVDYTLATSVTVTFAPGQTSQVVLFTVNNDTAVEPTETFQLMFDPNSIVGNAVLGAISAEEVSIVDDDATTAVLQFGAPTYTFGEGGVSGIVTVTRSGNTTSTVGVDFFQTDLTASGAGVDYTVTDGTLTFNPGEITRTIPVLLTDDASVESIETFRLTLDETTLTGGAVLGANVTADVSIVDNEGQATIQFGQSNYVVSEGIGTFTAIVTRSGDASTAVDVDVIPVDITAVNGGTDYTLTNPTAVHFDAGETTQTVSITVIDDSSIEQTESFLLTFDAASLSSSAILGAVSTAQADIVDNDGNATVEFKQALYTLGEGLGQGIVFAVRSGDTSQSVTVPITVTDVTATGGGTDYDVTTTTLTFGVGESVKTFNVTLSDDVDIEPTESFLLEIGAPTAGSAILGVNSIAQVDILDNDGAATFAIEKSEYVIGEGGVNLAVVVTRSGSTALSQTVDVATSDVSAAAGTDYTDITTTTLTFGVGVTSQVVLIPVLEDTDVEASETFSVFLSNATSGAVLGLPSTAVATIVDNDGDATIEFSPLNYTFSEGLGVVTMTVIRSGDASSAVTVPFVVNPVSAGTPADFTVTTASPLVFGAGVTSQIITVTLVDDTVIEPTETFRVTLSPPTSGSAVLGVNSAAQVDILDNDGDAVLEFSEPLYSFHEGVGTATVLVTRSGDSSTAVTVPFTAADVSATAADYAISTASPLSFAAGETTKTITVSLTDDTEVEEAETFLLFLGVPTGGAILGTDSTTEVEIIDNDNAGILEFTRADYDVVEDSGTAILTVTRSGGSDGAVSVDVATTPGTAASPTDFGSVTTTLTWADGDSSAKTVTVPIVADLLVEETESFTALLSNPTGEAVLGSTIEANVNILDDEAPGTLSFSSDTYLVEEAAGTVTLSVLRNGGTKGTVTVHYATLDGSATSPTDFDATSGTLTWNDGDASPRVISVPIKDTDNETLRQFSVVLSAPSGGAQLAEPSIAQVKIGFGEPSVPNSTDGGGCSLVSQTTTPSPTPITLVALGAALLACLRFLNRKALLVVISMAVALTGGAFGCNKRPLVPAEATESLVRLVQEAREIANAFELAEDCTGLEQAVADLNGDPVIACNTGNVQVSALVNECNDSPDFLGTVTLVAVAENCVDTSSGTTVDGTVTYTILTDGTDAVTFSSAGVTVNGTDYPVAGVTVTLPAGSAPTCEGVLTVLDLPCTVTPDCSTCEFLD